MTPSDLTKGEAMTTKYQIRFKCGAVLPKSRWLDEKPDLSAGKGRLLVYGGSEGGRPTYATGKRPDCLFGCPCKREAKRRHEKGWAEGATGKPTDFVSCKPTIVSREK